jgi:hypothetical protein
MKKTLIVLAAAMMPAAVIAQPAPGWDSGAFWRGAPDNPRERIDFLQQRVNNGIADGSLDRHEGARVNGELMHVREWIRHMHYDNAGPLTPAQRDEIQGRLDDLSRQIRWMRHNGW